MKQAQNPRLFTHPIRVYYEDTDAGGVVYHANYLKFLERCRTEWLRAAGCKQAELLRDPGIAFIVRSVGLDYLKPARLDDLLSVSLEVEKITRAQIFFRQHVRRDGEVLVRGAVQIVCVRIDTGAGQMKPAAIPASWRAQLEAVR
jgi:acyl-CoA thioester hydrolase